jgi:nucleotide-binding universal stress UspA family protein
MSNYKSILAMADFSSGSDNAVSRAARLASEHDARLVLLTVVDASATKGLHQWLPSRIDIDIKVSRAQDNLERLAAKTAIAHRVSIERVVAVGDTLDQVRQHAQASGLVVFGVKRSNPLRDFVFGTPAERLMRMVRRPVLVVKKPARAPYQCVLVPIDFTAYSEAVLRSAIKSVPQAALHLCHAPSTSRETRLRAADVPEVIIQNWRERASARALERLNALIQSVEHRRATSSVGHGDPSRLALEAQTAVGAELIVVGKDGQSAIGDFLLGSVAQRLVSDAQCDVLVVPRAALPRYQARSGFAIDRSRLASSPDWSHHSWIDVDRGSQCRPGCAQNPAASRAISTCGGRRAPGAAHCLDEIDQDGVIALVGREPHGRAADEQSFTNQ